jgi:hypothetical protein
MEELDLLKKDWKKSEGMFPAFSNEDIYKMLHKKSSSIVKWILIISILEFLFFLSITFILSDDKSIYVLPKYIDIPLSIIYYSIILYFMVQFYLNYRKISATDNSKILMKSILHTRKTVSHYIIANIIFLIGSMAIMFIFLFNNDPNLLRVLQETEKNGTEILAYVVYIALAILGIAAFSIVFWLFYKLIYGLLLKRLHRNYQELKKIDF